MSDLSKTSLEHESIQPIDRRVRVHSGSFTLVDTDEALLFHEHGRNPVIFVPRRHLPVEFLHDDGHLGTPQAGRPTRYWNFSVGGQKAENGIWSFEKPQGELAALAGYVAFDATQVLLEVDGDDDYPDDAADATDRPWRARAPHE
jgi:uncharacterized protein (DUF427 family)